MLCKWNHNGQGVYTSRAYSLDGLCYHLRVESLPGRGWDWTIWLAGGSEAAVRHGYAEAAKRGMAAAEDAVAQKLSHRRDASERPHGRPIATPHGLLFPYWSISG
jgi:hypothetical protein